MATIPVDQYLDRAQRKVSTANLANFAGVDCQLVVEKETHRPVVMDHQHSIQILLRRRP